jgi:isocitrate dehydrogenase
MEIAKRDKMIIQLQAAIKDNHDGVLIKIKELGNIQKDNRFLGSVYEDYRRYRDYIIQEKEREKRQMERLVHYLEKIVLETNLTDNMTRRAIMEQNRILGQLDTVKKELDKLVSI